MEAAKKPPAEFRVILVELINPRWRGGSSAAFRVFSE